MNMNGKNVMIFGKYTLVGTFGLILDMAALFMLVEYVQMAVVPAAVIAFSVSVVNNFIFHKFWTFKDKSHHFNKQLASFFTISLINLGLTAGFMYVLSDLLDVWYLLAKLITAAIILIWSYWANRMWTFKIDTTKK